MALKLVFVEICKRYPVEFGTMFQLAVIRVTPVPDALSDGTPEVAIET